MSLNNWVNHMGNGKILNSAVVGSIKAKEIFSKNSIVIKSQLPFLILMIFYTALSLWIISQPIINH